MLALARVARVAAQQALTTMKKLRIVILAKVWHGATEKGP